MITSFKDFIFEELLNEEFENEKCRIIFELFEWLENYDYGKVLNEDDEKIDKINTNNKINDKPEANYDDKKVKKENDAKRAEKWYDELVDTVKTGNQSKNFSNYKKSNSVIIGHIYAFRYDPKHKDKLIFFDNNPLVLAFEYKQTKGGTGFLGVNLHFLPRYQRIPAIQYFINKSKESVMKKGEVNVDYTKDIKNNPKYKYLYYCIRHYLMNRVVGSFYVVPQEDYLKISNLYSGKYMGMSENEIVNYIKNQQVIKLTKSINRKKLQDKKDAQNKKRREQLATKRKQEKSYKFDTDKKIKETEKITGIIK